MDMTVSLWSGFYGSSYREMLSAARGNASWQEAFERSMRLHHANPPGEGHWEFLAIAYLHLVDLGASIAREHSDRIRSLVPLFQSAPTTSNWRLMQSVVRRRLAGEFVCAADLRRAKASPCDDGYLPDGDPKDPSTQYHAYLLLLILRFGNPDDAVLARIAHEAFAWLAKCDAAHGDPSALGRGRFQLFGYAAMAAAAALASRWRIPLESDWRAHVARAAAHAPAEGGIAPCWNGPHRARLLHGYNTTNDYQLFAELWRPEVAQGPDLQPRNGWWWHSLGPRSGLIADALGVRAAVLGAADEKLSTGAALRVLGARLIGRSEPFPEPVTLSANGIVAAGFRFQIRGRTLTMSSDAGVLEAEREVRSPVLWLKGEMMPQVRCSGCTERENHGWSATDGSRWSGVAFRLIRRGEVRVECEL